MRTPAPARWARRGLSVAFGGLAGLLVGVAAAPPASAHAILVSTDPADGAVLTAAPDRVTLTFDEPVQVRPGAVRLLDAAGTEVSTDGRTSDTRVTLTVPPGIGDGTYVVTFRVVSADSHPVSGGLSFSVGAPSAAGVTVPGSGPSRGVQVLRQAAEALGYLGLLVGAGVLVFQLVLLRGGTAAVRRRLFRVAAMAAATAVVAAVVLVPTVPAGQEGRGLSALVDARTWSTGLGSDQGLSSLLVLVGLGAGLLGTLAARPGGRRDRRRVAATALAFAGIALAWGAVALVGHTRTYGPSWLVLSADLLHVTTAGTWLGGLVGLAVILSRSTEVAAPAAARTVAGFSRTAAVLVALLGLGGTLLGWRILRSWGALFGTSYGVALLTKVGIAAVVVAVAAHNRFRLLPRVSVADRESGGAAAWRVLRRTVRVEASLLVVILAATGVLVTQSPVQDRAGAASGSGGAPLVLEAALGTGRAVARLDPGSVGVNSLELSLLDGAGAPVAPVGTPELTVRLSAASVGPLSRPLSRTGPGRYQAVADFPLPGTWTVQVSVRTSKYDNPVARFTMDIR